MTLNEQIAIVQKAIDKLQIRFEQAIKRRNFLKAIEIDDVIYRLNDGKRKLEERRDNEETPEGD